MAPVKARSLKVIQPSVEHLFWCEHLRALLSFRACLERQQQRARVHRSKTLRARFLPCGLGECEDGQEVEATFPDYRTERVPVTVWGHSRGQR